MLTSWALENFFKGIVDIGFSADIRYSDIVQLLISDTDICSLFTPKLLGNNRTYLLLWN